MTLLVAPCGLEAARVAVRNWHYSRKMPTGKLVLHGAWEDEAGLGDLFVGSVMYGRGANLHMAGQHALAVTEVAELVRVALDEGRQRQRGHHTHPTTAVVAASLRLLHRTNPGLRLVVSYADPAQGHVGTIYQAGNWTYAGTSSPQSALRLHGRLLHKRTVSSRYGRADVLWLREHVDPAATWVMTAPKHQYLMPLDRAMRRQLQARALPFPHAGEGSEVS